MSTSQIIDEHRVNGNTPRAQDGSFWMCLATFICGMNVGENLLQLPGPGWIWTILAILLLLKGSRLATQADLLRMALQAELIKVKADIALSRRK